ncbi:MAG: ADOP family duplicated permease [Dokdonella sp.]
MIAFLAELKTAARSIATRPAFAALVIGVLAAGLACVIFMLAVLDGFLIRPLPFAQPQQLLQAGFHGDGGLGDVFPVTSRDFLQIRRQLDTSAQVAGVARSTINLSDVDRAERYNGGHVSANLFQLLGVAPLLGRDFAAADERPGAPAVVMLSYELWQGRYGGDAAIIGRQIRVDAKPATVIGVMPENFSYPRRELVWIPAALADGMAADDYAYWLVLRRREGIGDVAVTAAFETWFADAAKAEPDRMRSLRPRVEPLSDMVMDRTTRSMLGYMLVAVCMVLLIACANATNLLLTRTLGRRQELAVRVALGASRARLILHLFAESLLLSVIATGIALLLAQAGLHWQQSLLRQSEFSLLWLRFEIDPAVWLFALAAALVTAALTGVLPALRAGESALGGGLRDAGRGIAGGSFARASRGLVIGEIALSCALLICLGTLVRGIALLDGTDLGIDTDHLLTARISLPLTSYPDDASRLHMYEHLADRLRADATVVDASIGTVLPGTWYNESHDLLAAGDVPGDVELPQVSSGAVDDHFLAAYGIGLQQGRFFDDRDSAEGPRVAVVDRQFAQRYGGNGGVLGRRFRFDPRDPQGAVVTVIGVVGALKLNAPGESQQPVVLTPLRQGLYRIASIGVRTRGDANLFATRLRDITAEVDADTPLYWIRDYAAVISNTHFGEHIVAQTFALFGLIALVLAGVGLYGVTAFGVDQRTREIGVRRALGAPGGPLLRKLFARSFAQLGIGIAIGVGVGIPFSRLLSGSLRTIEHGNLAVVLGALGVLIVATGFAVAVPALRALRVDPMIALRHE